ncbi:MAG: phosphotransferase family protein [Myxococcota bacterium]
MPEGIRAEPVTTWFRENAPGVRPPLRFELLAGGHSNLTYKVTDAAGATYVLRRPPLGGVLESAHDMGREHKIVSALGPTDVPVPPILGLCTDTSINDASFYVMEFVPGVVLYDSAAGAALPEADRRRLGCDTIDVLVRLHAIDPDAVGLGDLGRKEGYVARQLRRWSRQWANSKTREIPEMEATHRELEKRMPEQVGACIAHGDYRLGNFIVRDGHIAAVLDWELCTLGDALADVGYLLNNWVPPQEATDVPDNTPTAAGGFPDRDELCERYARASGRDLDRIDYYRAFSYWRSAAITEGVYRRYIDGSMGSAEGVDTDRFERAPPRLAARALELVSRV